MSLRARLLIGMLVLTAAGLAILGFVSYAALRSYLSDRVDQQATAAITPVTGFLTAKSRSPGGDSHQPLGGPPFPQGEGGKGPLPTGAYGAILQADGEVLLEQTFGYGESGLPKPNLGSPAPLSDPDDTTTFDASAGGDDAATFRVAEAPLRGTPYTVAAAIPLDDFNATLAHVRNVEILVSLAVLAALAGLGLYVTRLGLRPLSRMEDTARAIAAGDLSRRVETVDERTEVGRLGAALNEMLHRIERAFAEREASEERMRRFLADASHELRTPLASIRGYAELRRIGATSDPREVDAAMGKIEDESKRMGALVDDLLALARLDEVRSPVREPVDLWQLASECRDDAALRAPERSVVLDGDAGIAVLGDEEALRRLIRNLLDNALRHTPAGSPIEVRVARDGAEARVSVRDHGAGLPPGEEERVFERFWRTGSARSRADGGSGLGLAIVAAIAHAHGGSATASTAPGGGAVFEVLIPVAARAPVAVETPRDGN